MLGPRHAAGEPRAGQVPPAQQQQGRSGLNLRDHYARPVKISAAPERIEILLNNPDILSTHVHTSGGINELEGVGVSEAPRGTLFYHM